MAYCNNCGAYIPDGQGICLACGYDPAAAAAKAEAAAAQQSAAEHQSETSQNNEEMRRKLEEQRRRAREQNLKWAEEQKKRREEQAAQEAARKEQQEKEREWARQEYERRKAEQQAQQQAEQQNAAAAGQHYYGSAAAGAAAATGEGNKALAALSYISFLFILPGILTPQDEFARFHARQGLKLFIFGIIADILISAAGLGFLVWIARIYLAVKGISNAVNGRKEPLPYIGTIGGT